MTMRPAPISREEITPEVHRLASLHAGQALTSAYRIWRARAWGRGGDLSDYESEALWIMLVMAVRWGDRPGELFEWSLGKFLGHYLHPKVRDSTGRARRLKTGWVFDPPDSRTVPDPDAPPVPDLDSVLENVGGPDRELMRLRYQQNLDWASVAALLGISVGNVRKRHERLCTALHALIGPEGVRPRLKRVPFASRENAADAVRLYQRLRRKRIRRLGRQWDGEERGWRGD